jgi:radical SAM protein with 4Fe4S-binding SPASM domain
MTRKIGYMDFELYKKILKEIPTLRHIFLQHFGESTFHSQIGDFISYASKKGIVTSLSTNGTSLKKVGETLINSGLDRLYVCVDGHDKKSYEEIRAGSTYEDLLENLNYFLLLKDNLKTKPFVEIQIIQTPSLAKKMAEKFWAEFPLRDKINRVRFKPYDTWGGQVERVLEFGQKGARKARDFGCPVISKMNETTVLWDGTVVPCCRDFDGKINLGDLKTQSFEKIFFGEPYRKLRENNEKLNFDNDLCRFCENRVQNFMKIRDRKMVAKTKVLSDF